MPVPSSGMSNAYLYCEADFEEYDDGRVVVTDVTSDDTDLSTAYKWAVGDHAPVNSRRVVEDAERLKEDEEAFSEEEEEEEEALLESRGAVLWTAATRCKAITVPRFVLPGLPNLLLPLDTFPQPTPWNMTGAICRTEQGKIRTEGWEVSVYEAWAIANVVHTFKSILVLRDNTEFTTKAGYYTPAATNFTFPLLRLQDQQSMPVILQNLEKKPGTTTVLPELTSPYFQGRLTYTTHIMSRGVASTTTSPAKIIRG